jgi:formylglycine-generating enzyme required for sulfatase activity
MGLRSAADLLIPVTLPVPGGRFRMGDDAGRFDEAPAHDVTVGPFVLGRFPVTNREYRGYLAATEAASPPFIEDARFNDPLQPVVGVNWYEAVAFCAWLTNETGRIYRLPTEAEREWAALGGLLGARYPWGNDEPPLVGPWGRGRFGQLQPVPVSDAAPNGFGLCHMCDNVHEWCSDWWDETYYARSPGDDPRGPEAGERRASRGGAWRHDLKFSRCSARSSLPPDYHYNDYGFRVAATLLDPR